MKLQTMLKPGNPANSEALKSLSSATLQILMEQLELFGPLKKKKRFSQPIPQRPQAMFETRIMPTWKRENGFSHWIHRTQD